MKKFLSIFLIFFLLFSVSVPAFAAEADIVPPSLDSTGCDSYLISYRNFTNGTTDYNCYLYSSSDWQVYTPPGKEYVQFLSLVQSPSSIYVDIVGAESYNPDSDNNGWGEFTPTSFLNSQFSDGTVFYYTTMQGYLILSNRDVPYATLNYDTNSLDYTGEFFFTLTPPLVVEVGKALTQFQIQTIQTIMIIVLCGVGCLALLISLPILKKVYYRFLNK